MSLAVVITSRLFFFFFFPLTSSSVFGVSISDPCVRCSIYMHAFDLLMYHFHFPPVIPADTRALHTNQYNFVHYQLH